MIETFSIRLVMVGAVILCEFVILIILSQRFIKCSKTSNFLISKTLLSAPFRRDLLKVLYHLVHFTLCVHVSHTLAGKKHHCLNCMRQISRLSQAKDPVSSARALCWRLGKAVQAQPPLYLSLSQHTVDLTWLLAASEPSNIKPECIFLPAALRSAQ